jgi:hypothetical protein
MTGSAKSDGEGHAGYSSTTTFTISECAKIKIILSATAAISGAAQAQYNNIWYSSANATYDLDYVSGVNTINARIKGGYDGAYSQMSATGTVTVITA